MGWTSVFSRKKRVRQENYSRETLTSLRHAMSLLETAFDATADGLLIIDEFDTTGPDTRTYDCFSVNTRPVTHRPESIAFRLTANGVSVVYSGDTDTDDNLIRLAKDGHVSRVGE